MYGKTASIILVSLLVINASVLAYKVQLVKSDYTWTETIYIRSNGSVEPLGAPISTLDNITYTLTDKIIVGNVPTYTKAIVVERDNILIDGAGFEVYKDYGEQLSKGIYLLGRSNVTIKRLTTSSFNIGIYAESSYDVNISGNKLVLSWGEGIQLYSCSDNIISGNDISAGEGLGIVINSGGLNNSIIGNNIKWNFGDAIFLGSSNSSIVGNNIDNNYIGVVIASNYNVISGNNMTGRQRYGIESYGSYNIMSGNNIANNLEGIDMHAYEISSNNSIIGNNITSNENYGISFYGGTTNNSITGNTIASNGCGIRQNGDYNSISRNNIASNGCGILLYYGSDNAYWHNNFLANTQSTVVQYSDVNAWDNDYPSGGNYWSDYTGVDVKKGSNQNLPGSDDIGDTPFTIDVNNRDRYPLMYPYGSLPPSTFALIISAGAGGTTDPAPETYTYSEGQNVPVQAIPNTEYCLDHWELDGTNVGSVSPCSVLVDKNHTLYATFRVGFHDVAVTNVTPSEIIVGQGYSLNITVTAANQGDYEETFNVTTYVNTTIINQTEVTLISGKSTTFNCTWNTTGFTEGNYTLSAVADVIANEADTLDNTYTDGIVTVRLLSHGIAVVNVTTSKTGCLPMPTVGLGYDLTVNVTVANMGETTETFNVTSYANETIIATFTDILLTSGSSITLTFTWNTSGFAKGNCTISAYAWPVPGETNSADNFTGCWVKITIVADVNGDGKVNLIDVFAVSLAYGSYPGHPKWNPNYDINNDNKINLIDYFITALNYGKTDT